jgi:hypothetical protein
MAQHLDEVKKQNFPPGLCYGVVRLDTGGFKALKMV